MLVRLGIEEGEAIIHPWINKAIEKAQQKVEARNYDIRKNVVKYDDVMNDQRTVIYDQRREIMDAEEVSETVKDMREDVAHHLVETHIPPKSYPEQWDMEGMKADIERIVGIDIPVTDWAQEEGIEEQVVVERLAEALDKHMNDKAAKYGNDFWGHVEKSLLLQVVDQEWKDHLANLDHLRQSVGLRAYGQRDPLNEYKTEAFSLFESMLYHTRESLTQLLAKAELAPQIDPAALEPQAPSIFQEEHLDPMTGQNEMAQGQIDPNDPMTWSSVPRNAPCPCGSGEKFKHCHGDVSGPLPASLQPSASGNQPVQNPMGNVGRNDKCPCGSGKKYKHCHGAI